MTDAAAPGEEIVHASCVAFGDRGALITGASGSGKSSLALLLIALGADLVADDRVALALRDGAVAASAPTALFGLIEARGVGLIRMAAATQATVVLVADLDGSRRERLPRPSTRRLLRTATPLISVRPNAVGASVIAAFLRGGDLLDPDADAG